MKPWKAWYSFSFQSLSFLTWHPNFYEKSNKETSSELHNEIKFSMFKIYTFLNLMKVAPKEGVKTGYSRLLVQHFGKTLHVHVCRKNITHCWFYRDL